MNNKRGSGLKYLFSGTLHLPVTAKSNHHYIFKLLQLLAIAPFRAAVFFSLTSYRKIMGVGGRGEKNRFFRSGLLFSPHFYYYSSSRQKNFLCSLCNGRRRGIGSWKRCFFHDPSFACPSSPLGSSLFSSSNSFLCAISRQKLKDPIL